MSSAAAPRNTPFVLIVRDGWGENPNPDHDSFNAIKLAKTPVDDALRANWPATLIHTSGEDVGLPEGTMGNSEVGHQNIGAGRIVDQDSVRITKAIRTGDFFKNEALIGAVRAARDAGRSVHLMGIASDAGVHGLLEHLYACLELCRREGCERVFIHAFTDGRDTAPFSGKGFLEQIASKCGEIGVGRIASVIGRYYAMDRDNRWERVAAAYHCLTGRGRTDLPPRKADDAPAAAALYYEQPTNDSQRGDEFITPTVIVGEVDAADSRIVDGDAVIFYNYRGDRPRELVKAFVLPDFEGSVKPSPDTGNKGFDRGDRLDVRFVCMTAYEADLNPYVAVAYPKPPKMTNIGGAYFSEKGLRQFRCAETEKFPHVTFFFNDYRDDPFQGEERKILQSPRVATYDLQPEMSAAEVRDAVLERLNSDRPDDVIVVNFANPDMVGHTGKLGAAIKAVETVDRCVGAIMERALELGGSLIITADHGNAEQMWDPDSDSPHTSHTTYDVPLFVVGEPFRDGALRDGGRLADIIPTAIEMMGMDKPREMTGESLLQ
ncbi:MAG: 2,3-bisphosphoglycerate-independent phosphoglycerate mutase [Planctomycetota bacterium]|nr:2,3-bisphosphoglycerate-independent phosphoglycerate mutase [Planctomycetota bacterium]